MLSSVLRSPRAIQVNIAIMRVFVRLRETLALHKELAHKLAELERKIEGHDTSIRTLFDAIRELAAPPARPRWEIGFHIKGFRPNSRAAPFDALRASQSVCPVRTARFEMLRVPLIRDAAVVCERLSQ